MGEIAVPGTVIALYGDLGAGKTVFAKGIGKGLEVADMVTSPSFVLMNVYYGRLALYHFDFYRLGEEEELLELGLEEFLYGEGVTLIEWAGKFPSVLPSSRVDVFIEYSREELNSRLLYFKPSGEFTASLVEEMRKACYS